MDERELRKLGQKLTVGADLYGVSVEQLKERLSVVIAEQARIEAEIAKKSKELTMAEGFFKKP